MADNLNINVMMIGGRRCGKTSVLAVMKRMFDTRFASTNLNIKASDKTVELNDKYQEMVDVYSLEKGERFTPDDGETKEMPKYGIDISLNSKPNGKIHFTFIDFPGEWLQSDEHSQELKSIVAMSSIILVAIDTPFLMEEAPNESANSVGKYNDKRNRTGAICDFLKELDLNKNGKMVLFVPLKCERYLHDGQMDLVNKRVHTAYKLFFDYINNDFNRTKCTTAITPIFSFGTVEFARFERDGADIIMDPKYQTPRYPLYQFTDDAGNEPEPLYCEQPLLYVLLYVLKCAEVSKRKENNNWFLWLFNCIGETFFQMPSADDFLKEIHNIQKAIKISGDGYEIVTDPNGMKGLL